MARVQISRDPFARETLIREVVAGRSTWRPCNWCGQPGRFHYSIESDGGRVSHIRGMFCSVGCMRSYHS